jgi:GWxTD domain-containing protein
VKPPRSSQNIFKEKHYRRIAYANEHFASGIPGWKTDRGMIYIKLGKPDQLESHPTGGYYARPNNQGGGNTATCPFEVWLYRHVEGKGDDVEIEFVDKSRGNEYRIALSPDEKDDLLNVPGVGLTLAEKQGLAKKEDRAIFNPGARNDPNNPLAQLMRYKDTPFGRVVLAKSIPLISFSPGKYILEVEVMDNLTKPKTSDLTGFSVK